jgi:hypothetical protein
MCQMHSPVRPTFIGESTPPSFNGALALYPTLNSDSQQTSPSQSDPNLHLAGLLVPGAADAFGRVWTSKLPKEFMAPELPPILPLPGPRFAPLIPRPIAPAPAPPAPIGGPLFKPVNPDANQASPPPFPVPPPAGPTLSPPSKPPAPPEPEQILPDGLAKPGGQIVGGGFSIPKDPHAPLPGFSPPDDDNPARALVLEMEVSRARPLENDKYKLVPKTLPQLIEYDARFKRMDEIYREAGRLVTKSGGPALGNEWHHLASKIAEKYAAEGIRAEVSYAKGDEETYGKKDTARVDLVWTHKDGTIVIVDLKTGGARLSAAQIKKIVENVGGEKDARVLVYQYKP